MKMQVATKLEKVTKKKYDKYNIKLLVQEQTSAIQYIFFSFFLFNQWIFIFIVCTYIPNR